MRIANTRFVLLASAFSVAALLLEPATAQAQKKASANRDAVIRACLEKMNAEQPWGLPGSGAPERRTALYRDCMVRAGQRP